jgi:hypothetical protein
MDKSDAWTYPQDAFNRDGCVPLTYPRNEDGSMKPSDCNDVLAWLEVTTDADRMWYYDTLLRC